jgi:hypothetical protein
MSTHNASGQPTTTSGFGDALPRRPQSNAMSPPQLFLCAKYATVSIIRKAIRTPGRMPARNSAPTLTLAIIP